METATLVAISISGLLVSCRRIILYKRRYLNRKENQVYDYTISKIK